VPFGAEVVPAKRSRDRGRRATACQEIEHQLATGRGRRQRPRSRLHSRVQPFGLVATSTRRSAWGGWRRLVMYSGPYGRQFARRLPSWGTSGSATGAPAIPAAGSTGRPRPSQGPPVLPLDFPIAPNPRANQGLPTCSYRPSGPAGRLAPASNCPLHAGSNPGAASNFPLIVHQPGPAPAREPRAIEAGALALSGRRRAAASRVLRSSSPSRLPRNRSPDSRRIRPPTTACAHSRSGATRCVRGLMPNALRAFRY